MNLSGEDALTRVLALRLRGVSCPWLIRVLTQSKQLTFGIGRSTTAPLTTGRTECKRLLYTSGGRKLQSLIYLRSAKAFAQCGGVHSQKQKQLIRDVMQRLLFVYHCVYTRPRGPYTLATNI